MDRTPGGQNSVPISVDRTKVLDVKPIRSLIPIFASSPNFSGAQGGPFASAPPSGPFPPGVSPFYPFFGSPDSQNAAYDNTPISNAVPINSFRTPNGDVAGSSRRGRKKAQPQEDSDEDMDPSDKKKKRRAKASRDINVDVDIDSVVNDILASFNLVEFDSDRRSEGNRESVSYVRLVFDLLRKKLCAIDELKGENPAAARRPDLKAGTILLHKGIRTNVKKRVGVVPGVEIGDIFFFRIEMCVVGIHAPSMAGIDYMSVRAGGQEDEPLAVSIVSSGGYEDNAEDEDVLIYSGQGGKDNADQKLERGNLALEKSLHRGNEVRVIRGLKDIANPSSKIYIYDGLYKIQESWIEKGKTGFGVFKYKLVRIPGQPPGWTTWKMVQQWKDGVTTRSGVILPDLTSGAENIPVSLVNDIDDEKGPAYFTYISNLKYSRPIKALEGSVGCFCHGGCMAVNPNCTCLQKNGGDMVYTANGIIITPRNLIHECGPSCQCPVNCRNRASQGGLRVRLEVFRTKDKGWGLRSWDFIRAGAFICEYAGEVVDESQAEDLWGENEDDYLFDTSRSYQPMEIMPGDYNEPPKVPFPMVISAKNVGNVARFMNHSCSPNVFWLPVSRQNDKECDLHIAFYAIKHIGPMTELTYNYGMVPPEKSNQRKKKCFCGSPKCRGYFY
ncbi:hypothetical protein ACFE04_011810 [Oxalis oulophora]